MMLFSYRSGFYKEIPCFDQASTECLHPIMSLSSDFCSVTPTVGLWVSITNVNSVEKIL